MTTRPVRYPQGAWPAEMRSDMAAAYVDEQSVEAFLAKVDAGIYPRPAIGAGCQRKWSREALDLAIAARHGQDTRREETEMDIAEII